MTEYLEDHTPVVFSESTLFKVLDALVNSGLSQEQALNGIREMQNSGILFRERRPEEEKNERSERDDRPHSRACGIYYHPHGPLCKRDCPTCHP